VKNIIVQLDGGGNDAAPPAAIKERSMYYVKDNLNVLIVI
jgi:hypothetical protein